MGLIPLFPGSGGGPAPAPEPSISYGTRSAVSRSGGPVSATPEVDATSALSTRLGNITSPAATFSGVPDPALSRFDINVNAGTKTLTLRFNRYMDVSTLDVTKITVQDAATAVLSYALQDSTTASSDGMTVVLNLGTLDYAGLTGTPGLADSQAHTWIRLAANAILDLVDAVSCATIPDGSAMNVTTYTS